MNKRLKKIEGELWLPVPNSNNHYLVSNFGRVKSFMYNKTEGRIMRTYQMGNFLTINIRINKKMVNWYIHKLVATVFIPKTSEELTHVVHLDLNYKNNQASNLQWVKRETVLERTKIRKTKSNIKQKPTNTKLKESDIALLKSMILSGIPNFRIAKLFCISDMQVTRIKRGENWGYVQPKKVTD